MTKRRFFRTVIELEVLSEEQPVGDCELGAIIYRISEGDCIGDSRLTSEEEISPAECARRLIAMRGSEVTPGATDPAIRLDTTLRYELPDGSPRTLLVFHVKPR